MTERRKKRLQIYVEPELAEELADIHAQYRENGKPVAKNAIGERLLRDGLRFWAREDQVSNRIESTLARMADVMASIQAMQHALAFRSLGEDEEIFQEYLSQVEKMKEEHHG